MKIEMKKIEKTNETIETSRNAKNTIDIIVQKMFPDGCPKTAGHELGAFNLLCNLHEEINKIIGLQADIRKANTALTKEETEEANNILSFLNSNN